VANDPCTGDPVSWLLVEDGWRVVDRDGNRVGSVQEVLGDTGVDIFDGLAVKPGVLGTTRYVPSERVRGITEGCIELDLDADDFERLDEHTESPGTHGAGATA
jgi:hypothetical protein